MNKSVKVILTICLMSILSACGSGGGGGTAALPSVEQPAPEQDPALLTVYTVRRVGATGTINFEICYDVNTVNEACEQHSMALGLSGSDGVAEIELYNSVPVGAHTIRITAPWQFQVSNPKDPFIDLNYPTGIAYISF